MVMPGMVLGLAGRCAEALQPLGRLQEAMQDDLDPVGGGFGWWRGHIDQPRVVLASDYLLAVVGTVARSLRQAAFHEAEFERLWATKSGRLLLAGRNRDGESLARALHRGEADEERDTAIDAHIDAFFVGVGSALDQTAALMIGVAALKVPIVKADWGDLRRLSTDPRARARALDEEGTAGRAAQTHVLGKVDEVLASQEAGWLGWTTALRNSLVHRADRINIEFFYRPDRQTVLQLVHLLPAHPARTDAETFVRGGQGRRREVVADLVVPQHAGNLMAGVLESTVGLLAALAEALLTLWEHRRADPKLLVQPGQQWKQLWQAPLSDFEGFGSRRLPVPDDELRVSPATGLRLRAAKVFDADRSFWEQLE